MMSSAIYPLHFVSFVITKTYGVIRHREGDVSGCQASSLIDAATTERLYGATFTRYSRFSADGVRVLIVAVVVDIANDEAA
jgi:hypothetical protein